MSLSYPTSKWPIPDGVQIPLWAQQDARLWTNMQFNSAEAQQIATSGKLIGLPLGSSSTISPTANSLSSPSGTMSASVAPISPPSNDSQADIGPIVGGVVGGVLGLLFIGVLIWWIIRRRWSSFEDANPSMHVVPFTGSNAPTPAQVKMVVPVPQRAFHQTYPSYTSSPPPTSRSTGNTENGHGSPAVVVQHAPGALDHPWGLISHPYATSGIGLSIWPPSMSSSSSVGLPSNTPQRMGDSSSRSTLARFVFSQGRKNRHSDAPSTMSQPGSMGQIDILQSPPANVGHLPQTFGLSPVPGQVTLEPTPYIPPPQEQAPSPEDSTSHLQVMTRPSINPPGYTPPEAAIASPLPQPNPAIQAHMTRPFNTDVNRMMVATPAPRSPETPDLPSYMASQAESWEERLRRAASVATAGTHASSSNILPTPSTPERRGDPLPPVPECAASPQNESDYPQEKV